ncbi:MAG: GAF domain-containing protein [Streptosporangiales bacterium]|nr:GAF domain-containing protein [Streptosporangiales bacterium]
MTSAWVAWPGDVDPRRLSRSLHLAHERFVSTGIPDRGLRGVVADSWQRSMTAGVDPDAVGPPIELSTTAVDEYRQSHPLAAVMPIIRQLLVRDAVDNTFVVAVTDADGRLLWVEGDPLVRERGEDVHLVAGATWREDVAGTNAVGTALVLGHPVQVFAAEHFTRTVQPYSCTAVPIRDPATSTVLGAVDVTGGDSVATPQVLTMVRAAVAAAEGELRLRQLVGSGRHAVRHSVRVPLHVPTGTLRLAVLGHDAAVLDLPGRSIRLSLRHAELLLLLVLHPGGLTAEQLSVRLHDHDVPTVTVRAELSRLRRMLGGGVLASRPYRFLPPVETDVAELRRHLDRGAYAEAFELYGGPVLPRSEAPGIVPFRDEEARHLRDTLLAHAPPEILLTYAESPDGRDDVGVWQACLDRLPPTSPRRTRARSRLHWLHRELSTAT